MKRHVILTFFCALFFASELSSETLIVIESPRQGFSTSRVQVVRGRIEDSSLIRAAAIINGIPQTIPVSAGTFSFSMVPSPGMNTIEIQANNSKKAISFYAQVPKRDIKILLTWDTPTDVDLWVIDPAGDRCYYGANSTPSGGNLDVDVTTGFGPETFTMAKAMPGTYSVQCQYYSSAESPITRGRVFVILNEGTPKESRKDYSFVMTRQYDVYDICSFVIDE
jgi:uncharacterized protein YfaP (DUF2135 family)